MVKYQLGDDGGKAKVNVRTVDLESIKHEQVKKLWELQVGVQKWNKMQTFCQLKWEVAPVKCAKRCWGKGQKSWLSAAGAQAPVP